MPLAWSGSEVIAAEGCGADPPLNIGRLVEINEVGQIARDWPLPACIDGISGFPGSDGHDVLLDAHVGYGNGECGKAWASEVLVLHGGTLRTVSDLPGPFGSTVSSVVAW